MPLMTTEERLGKTIDGKYRLDRVLGEGGMGVVYEGMHVRLGRAVAVKFLHPQFSQNAEVVQRFVREAQSAARLQHPNVVDVRDIDTAEDGSIYMVLELLAGESISDRLSSGAAVSLADTLTMLLPLMDAVAVAHEHGIVHRDIKPDNLFLSRSPGGTMVPKVLDFGIAKLAQTVGAGSTGTGSVIGTPAYMAPEQAMGKKDVGPPADVWSMGMVLYECLTGRYPFDFPEDAPPTAVIVTVVTSDPYPISRFRADLPPQVAAALDASLAKDPTRRYPNMRTFLDTLRSVTVGLSEGVANAGMRREATGPTMVAGATGPGAWSAAQVNDAARASQSGHGSQPGYGSQSGYGSQPGQPAPAGYASQSGYGSQPGQGGHATGPYGAAATSSMHGPTPFVSGGTVAHLESSIAAPRRPIAMLAALGVVGTLVVVGGAVAFSGVASSPATPDLAAAAAPTGVEGAGIPTEVAPTAAPVPPPVAAALPAAPVIPAATAVATGATPAAHHGHGDGVRTTAVGTSSGTAAPLLPAPPVIIAVVPPPVPAVEEEPPAEPPARTGGSSGTRVRAGSGSSSGGSSSGGSSSGGSSGTPAESTGRTTAPRSGSMSADDF